MANSTNTLTAEEISQRLKVALQGLVVLQEQSSDGSELRAECIGLLVGLIEMLDVCLAHPEGGQAVLGSDYSFFLFDAQTNLLTIEQHLVSEPSILLNKVQA